MGCILNFLYFLLLKKEKRKKGKYVCLRTTKLALKNSSFVSKRPASDRKEQKQEKSMKTENNVKKRGISKGESVLITQTS